MNLSDKQLIFEGGRDGEKNGDGVYSYRIPALLKTKKGTLIAGADQRHNHKYDWGNIDMVIRRSEDDGKSWGDIIPILDLPTNMNSENSNFDSALLIDMNLVQDPETLRIFAFYDMYPEQRGLFGMLEENRIRESQQLETIKEEQYSVIKNKHYLNLYDDNNNHTHIVDNEGNVFDLDNNITEFSVILKSTIPPYSNTGDLYNRGKLVGNIFFTTNITGKLRVAKESYIWMSYSDDDGKNWSSPIDITPQIKLPWMKFYGIGPGIGLVLKHGKNKGRIIIPTYSSNHPFELDFSQSSRVIYSDDHGKSWKSGEAVNDKRMLEDGTILHSESMYDEYSQNTEACAVELKNGQVKLFMRNKTSKLAVATSFDGGESWDNHIDYYDEVNEVYVQLSAISVLRDRKEYIVLVNADGPQRTNGHVRVAEVGESGQLRWLNKRLIQKGNFAYNALQQIGSDTFACLYEHNYENQNEFSLYLRTFNWEFIVKK